MSRRVVAVAVAVLPSRKSRAQHRGWQSTSDWARCSCRRRSDLQSPLASLQCGGTFPAPRVSDYRSVNKARTGTSLSRPAHPSHKMAFFLRAISSSVSCVVLLIARHSRVCSRTSTSLSSEDQITLASEVLFVLFLFGSLDWTRLMW